MYAIAQASVLARDGLDITLLYSNKTKGDILLRAELSELAESSDDFKLHHTLTRHDEGRDGEWLGLTGRVTWKMMQSCGFPKPANDVLILTCGPKGLNETVRNICRENGYQEGEMFV